MFHDTPKLFPMAIIAYQVLFPTSLPVSKRAAIFSSAMGGDVLLSPSNGHFNAGFLLVVPETLELNGTLVSG